MTHQQPTPRWFQGRLLKWFAKYGRHNLPWQADRSAYRVWISEIMLQQTQVATVIPYFERFMHRFGAIKDLAQAELDEVLALWAGLGYYSRARNLHKCARIVMDEHGGKMPTSVDELVDLPGIGLSTAGAILAQAHDHPAPILDGNVKRVFARLIGIKGYTGDKDNLARLWEIATKFTPTQNVCDYTQAIMDLGATLCKRKPDCVTCPMQDRCYAFQHDCTDVIPGKKPKRAYPTKATEWLILKHRSKWLMQKRPVKGIWGGLFSVPECSQDKLADLCNQLKIKKHLRLKKGLHKFTHYQLEFTPNIISLSCSRNVTSLFPDTQWLAWHEIEQLGLPKPVGGLLNSL